VLVLASASLADVIGTPYAMRFWGNVTINGALAPSGTVVDAYDPDGVHCGTYTIREGAQYIGHYGDMFVYGDDPSTVGVDEGCESGNLIRFQINGRDATPTIIIGDIYWENGFDPHNNVDLAVNDATFGISLADPPEDKTGPPTTTLRFYVGVQNMGNGLDFFSIEAASSIGGWTITVPDLPVYGNPGEIVYTYFDVNIPAWPGNDPNLLNYAVYSNLDPTARVEGSVYATAEIGTVYAVSLISLLDDRYVDADEVVVFDVDFTNTGNTTDDYQIAAYSAEGWMISLQAGFVTLNPGEDGSLFFMVTVPGYVEVGDMDVINYSIVSNSDPAVSDNGALELTVQDPTDVGDGDWTLLPNQVALAQNYPNPFNPTTTIEFNLPSRSRVSMSIIDILGRTVERMDMGSLSAGIHQIVYDASALSSGVYFYRLETNMGSESRKMMLLK